MKKAKNFLFILIACLCIGAFTLGFSACETEETNNSSYEQPDDDSSSSGNTGNSSTPTTPETPDTPQPDATPTEGILYDVSADGTYAEVIGYTGTDTVIHIASTYNGLPVTKIYNNAFEDVEIKEITIPNSVTWIGEDAFDSWGIEKATIPTVAISSIKNNYLKEVVINGGEEIDYGAFQNCGKLTNITIPNSITYISNYAFEGCNNLQFNLYDNVKYLGNNENPYVALIGVENANFSSYQIHDNTKIIISAAFKGCERLTSITIPNSVIYINSSAFYKCSSLTSVTIPNSITSISDRLFDGCSNLTNITIPDSVTSIGYGAFEGCKNLTSITLPDGVTTIGYNAFYKCSSLTNIIIPNSVTSIDTAISNTRAFGGCPIEKATIPTVAISHIDKANLKEVIINGGDTISEYAFSGASNLTSVIILDSITLIDNYAFKNCKKLTSINIPKSVVSIGASASPIAEVFLGCSSLSNIIVDEDNEHYKSIDGNLYNKTGETLLKYCIGKTDASFFVPTGVTSIASYAFYNRMNLTNVKISDTVQIIGDNAFNNCANLESIILSKALLSIEGEAFRWCGKLTIIKFNGTMSEWTMITKGMYWNNMNNYYCIPATEVVCSDGTVAL